MDVNNIAEEGRRLDQEYVETEEETEVESSTAYLVEDVVSASVLLAMMACSIFSHHSWQLRHSRQLHHVHIMANHAY